ncbi:peptidase inhibitor family I36 protein [Kitasatospora sp. MMS16-BH015]|uniref:peptidase inhibitor family I36 protein n=1 Tax=Kitasatospora sp. MMS16-BH015 TaxID=2018025 RepID=UPI000CF2B635|nr:peptidase inhibitor family I36 protein [Kitasatospora sp. MMS16-BH015]
MSKKIALLGLAAASVLAGPAPAEAATTSVKVVRGHGLEACPADYLCLYENPDYNGSADARIWVIGEGKVDSLAASGGDDVARSAYMNANNRNARAYLYAEHAEHGAAVRMDQQVRRRLPAMDDLNGREENGDKVSHLNFDRQVSSTVFWRS